MTEVEATVVVASGQRGTVELPDGVRRSYLVRGRRLRPVCGDRVVAIIPTGIEPGLVIGITTRSTVLARNSGRDSPEYIAANIDQLVVVCAPTPQPDFFIVDRYLCAAELTGCRPAVVWNKSDLATAEPAALARYRDIGYSVLSIAAKSGANLEGVRTLVESSTTVIVGQSGVGKSSLINALCGEGSAHTGELSGKTGEGRHTTTVSVLHHIDSGGRLIDTPGVRDFIPWIPPTARCVDGFPEFRRLAAGCRFADCRHLHEPDCAVKASMEAGQVSPRRYESYRRLCV